LTLRNERAIKRVILSGECDTASGIARQALNLGLPRVSEAMVRRALRRHGLAARVKHKKPVLTKRHKALRLAWAREHRHWTVVILAWPPQSPDLNPIENVWNVFKQRVREGPATGSVKQLWERMEKVWWSMESSPCTRLVATMPGRVREVIKAQSTSVESRRVSVVQQDDLLGLLFDKLGRKIDHASYNFKNEKCI